MPILKIGLAKRELTPPVGVELCGYGYYLERRNVGATDPIFARSVGFEQDGKRYLLVDCDLVGADTASAKRIADGITARLGLSAEQMLLACIHTHSGPGLGSMTLTGCGEIDPDYADWAISQIIDCAASAFDELRPVKCAKVSTCEVADFGYDRTRSEVVLDNGLRALTFEFDEGRPLVLLNYGCHPVSFGRDDKVSADYPGAAVSVMDKAGLDALFLVGFCGDVDPSGTRNYDNVLEKGGRLADAYFASLSNARELTDLTIRSAAAAEKIKLRIPSEQEVNDYVTYLRTANNIPAVHKITDLWIDQNNRRRAGVFADTDDIYARFLMIGDVLLAGFSGEMTSELVPILRDAFPDCTVFHMGNLFDTRRYIASDKLFNKNTYETFGSTIAYSTTPIVRGEGERVVTDICNAVKAQLA